MSKKRIPRLPIYKTPAGTFMVDKGYNNGRRERPIYKTEDEAKNAAEQFVLERQNEGLAVFSLPQDVKMDAHKAHEILAPFKVSILEAASYYKNHVLAYRNAPKVKDIIDKMIAEKKINNRRDRTIGDLTSRLKITFGEDFGERQLHEIAKEEIEEWLHDEEWSPRSRINYHIKISQLYNFAKKKQWVNDNLTEYIDRPTPDDTKPEIFTVEQAENLLLNANDFGLLPYIALGLYAGLRTTELMKMKWEWINFAEKIVSVPREIAKKRKNRFIKMEDALINWLKLSMPLNLNGNIVSASNFRLNMNSLRAAAKIDKWPHNGLRHSFASYHLAEFENESTTARLMGHRDSEILHEHYKQLVLKSVAAKFWALRPKDELNAIHKKV